MSESEPKLRPTTQHAATELVETACPNCGARKMVMMSDKERIERLAAANRLTPPIPMPCALHVPSPSKEA